MFVCFLEIDERAEWYVYDLRFYWEIDIKEQVVTLVCHYNAPFIYSHKQAFSGQLWSETNLGLWTQTSFPQTKEVGWVVKCFNKKEVMLPWVQMKEKRCLHGRWNVLTHTNPLLNKQKKKHFPLRTNLTKLSKFTCFLYSLSMSLQFTSIILWLISIT